MFVDMITIIRPRTVGSRYASKPTLSFDDPERIEVPLPVSVQPRSSSEGDVSRPTLHTVWQLITQPGQDLDLRATDRVEVGSLVLSVSGEVHRFPLSGPVHHVEAVLERREG